MNKSTFVSVGAIALLAAAGTANAAQKSDQPNVIIVLLDDLGSTDVSFNGCMDIPTPNIDRVANEGVNCTDAYISAPYSGPSRCGIMTGRYQQRFGAEGNTEDEMKSIEGKHGILESEVLLGQVMREQGYNTCAIGKWHLGDHPDLWPNKRGFDYFYGFAGGGFSFWGGDKGTPSGFIQENGERIGADATTYLTDDFTDKTVEFIQNNEQSGDPFFVYLAYNAPHAPLQAPQKYLDRTKHIANAERSVYAAMILAVDDGLGRIWDELERQGIDDNTMIFFLSDNGGTGDPGRAMNIPRRSFKGNMFDGGIRTPFAMYWPGHIEAGTTYNKTISSLDIFATAVTAAGMNPAENKNPLDGTDLIPYFSGENTGDPHESLCWRVCGGMEYAIRKGDYKLVKTYFQDDYMLFNLKEDQIEMYDIAADHPELVKELAADYKKWDAQMMEPRWEDLHAPHQIVDHEKWDEYRTKASGGR
ncbi:MAG: sulfatase-like hydrolase/transferase [Rikenellaceae bacterium]